MRVGVTLAAAEDVLGARLPAPAELLPRFSGLKTSRNLVQAALPMAAGLFRTCFPALSPVHPLSAGGANTPSSSRSAPGRGTRHIPSCAPVVFLPWMGENSEFWCGWTGSRQALPEEEADRQRWWDISFLEGRK